MAGATVAWYLMPIAATPAAPALRTALEQQAAGARAAAAACAAGFGLGADVSVEDADQVMRRCGTAEQALIRLRGLREAAARAARDAASPAASVRDAARSAGIEAGPTPQDVESLRAQLEAARDRRARRLGLAEQEATIGRRIESLDLGAAGAARALAEAEAAHVSARAEWAAWLAAHDLSSLDRESAKTVLDAVTAAKRPLRALTGLSERRATLIAAHAAFVEEAEGVAMGVGLVRPAPTDRSGLDRLVFELADILRCVQETQIAAVKATEKLDDLRREEARARRAADQDAADLAALLTEHEAPDVDAARQAISRSDAARQLQSVVASCRGTLVALSGPGRALDALLAELAETGEIAGIAARLDAAVARLHEVEVEQAELREAAGALRDQIATIERDVAATETRQRREDLLGRLADTAERWAVAVLARHVLHGSREEYEAAHRPAVVQTAERYFSEWTEGRYTRIVAPLGSQIEAVEHRDGTIVPVGNLSTGTAQQLYLAIRFGLVERFSETAEPLPIVMDDILVNFDDERALLAARSIADLSTRHQVVYFTCHPDTPLRGDLEVELDRL